MAVAFLKPTLRDECVSCSNYMKITVQKADINFQPIEIIIAIHNNYDLVNLKTLIETGRKGLPIYSDAYWLAQQILDNIKLKA